MLKIFFSLLLFIASANALEEMGIKGTGGCVLSQNNHVEVGFTAYKTPLKIGVGGTFDKVSYTPNKISGSSFRDLFVGSSVVIDTKSVNSHNKGRDAKLVKFFFDNMSSQTITAEITGYTPDKRYKGKPKTGIFMVAVTMNGVTRNVPMRYSYFQGKMKAEGVIDLFDFSANRSLQAINKACYELHQGKTWNDVTISFTTEVKASLCHAK
ncbi:YceI family protein [Sulfurimonas paralvinellae]|uniref:YceI family protein n=1 Tax=Sulfurimonas paralvinellae TaxID=317658 RepID=A0A7M1B5T6_9BACT|nr:YceI family protein [Sulfurimonas paralvinellae]QOP45084.1 YceI family protein [Sulfurimonas paralvinellae]